MTQTTQFGDFVTLAKALLNDFGVTVTYGRMVPELTGQAVGTDNRTEQKLQLKVFFRTNFFRRQTAKYLPSFESVALMANEGFRPKNGDYLIKPDGKRVPIYDMTMIAPDDFPILYFLGIRDG